MALYFISKTIDILSEQLLHLCTEMILGRKLYMFLRLTNFFCN